MIDTHSHINFEEYRNNFDEFLKNIKTEGVEKVIIPSVNTSDFEDIKQLCEKYDMLYGAVGIHPEEAASYNDEALKIMTEYSKSKKIIAIGEIGLDYYWETQTKDLQQLIFNKQLELSENLRLPVLVHDRNAHEDTFEILNNYNNLKDVVFHCFSADKDFAAKCIDKGYYIAIGGIVTFKNAAQLKECVKYIPLDRILLETDAPYLAPVPFRGKINTPAYLKYIAEEVALIKGIDVQTVKTQTSDNAKRIFEF